MKKNKSILQSKNPVFSFVLEGNCERWYLELLKQHERLNINIKPKLSQKKKLQDQFEMVKTLSKESEKVFWVIDFDAILKETRETKKGNKTPLLKFQGLYNKCKKNEKIVVVINNPCLEYWFLQHFEQTSKYFETYEQLEKSLKSHLSDYEKTEKYYKNSRQNIYQKLKPNLPTAKTNAKKLAEFTLDNAQTGLAEMYKVFTELNI